MNRPEYLWGLWRSDQILIPTELPEQSEPAETREPEFGIGAEKGFRDYNPNQIQLLPQDLSEWVPAGHLARLVHDLVENVLNLTPIYASYKVARGAPPYHPKLLLKLLLYGYAVGIYSSRRLERAAQELVPCRYLTADQQPDHWTISEFRRRHLGAVRELFGQVLDVCQEAGLVKLGHVALDGTKLIGEVPDLPDVTPVLYSSTPCRGVAPAKQPVAASVVS